MRQGTSFAVVLLAATAVLAVAWIPPATAVRLGQQQQQQQQPELDLDELVDLLVDADLHSQSQTKSTSGTSTRVLEDDGGAEHDEEGGDEIDNDSDGEEMSQDDVDDAEEGTREETEAPGVGQDARQSHREENEDAEDRAGQQPPEIKVEDDEAHDDVHSETSETENDEVDDPVNKPVADDDEEEDAEAEAEDNEDNEDNEDGDEKEDEDDNEHPQDEGEAQEREEKDAESKVEHKDDGDHHDQPKQDTSSDDRNDIPVDPPAVVDKENNSPAGDVSTKVIEEDNGDEKVDQEHDEEKDTEEKDSEENQEEQDEQNEDNTSASTSGSSSGSGSSSAAGSEKTPPGPPKPVKKVEKELPRECNLCFKMVLGAAARNDTNSSQVLHPCLGHTAATMPACEAYVKEQSGPFSRALEPSAVCEAIGFCTKTQAAEVFAAQRARDKFGRMMRFHGRAVFDAKVASFEVLQTGTGLRKLMMHVSFASPYFLEDPFVDVSIVGLDGADEAGMRVLVKASHVTKYGFDLFLETWGNTKISRVEVDWFAYARIFTRKGLVRSGRMSVRELPSEFRRYIPFPKRFATTPQVTVGFAGLDSVYGHNVGMEVTAQDVSTRGFTAVIVTPKDAQLTWARMDWLAFVNTRDSPMFSDSVTLDASVVAFSPLANKPTLGPRTYETAVIFKDREICKPRPKVEPTWGYLGYEGPYYWARLSEDWATCSKGQRQSPVNIMSTAVPTSADIHAKYPTMKSMKIKNDGHTILVDLPEDAESGFQDTRGTDKVTMRPKKFQFHTPSENAVDGTVYAMELQIVHQSDDDRTAIVSVFFKVGAENAFLKKWAHIDQLPVGKGHVKDVADAGKASLTELFGTDSALNKFYHFGGSLTAPPCTEGVSWYVRREPVTATEEQIQNFAKILKNNVRPLQAWAGRASQDGANTELGKYTGPVSPCTKIAVPKFPTVPEVRLQLSGLDLDKNGPSQVDAFVLNPTPVGFTLKVTARSNVKVNRLVVGYTAMERSAFSTVVPASESGKADPTTATLNSPASPAGSCSDILRRGQMRGNGLYWIATSGGLQQLYCDMTNGGWMRVVNIVGDSRAHVNRPEAVNPVLLHDEMKAAKLSDEDISTSNKLGYFRVTCGSYVGYMKNSNNEFTSSLENDLNWASARNADNSRDFECPATAKGYGFGEKAAIDREDPDPKCPKTDYMLYGAGTDIEGLGCFHRGQGWGQTGAIWTR